MADITEHVCISHRKIWNAEVCILRGHSQPHLNIWAVYSIKKGNISAADNSFPSHQPSLHTEETTVCVHSKIHSDSQSGSKISVTGYYKTCMKLDVTDKNPRSGFWIRELLKRRSISWYLAHLIHYFQNQCKSRGDYFEENTFSEKIWLLIFTKNKHSPWIVWSIFICQYHAFIQPWKTSISTVKR
jgi:hypothetical protein